MGVLYFVGFIFLLIGGGFLVENSWVGIPFIALSIATFCLITRLENKPLPPRQVNNTQAQPSKPSLSPSDAQIMRDFISVKLQTYLEKLNDAYDLGLYDGDIYEISRSSAPFDELEKYVVPGPPTLKEFFNSLTKTMSRMSHGIGLDDDTVSNLDEFCLAVAQELTEQNDIAELVEWFALKEEDCSPETNYLVGKVDYIAITLSFFDCYAERYENVYIKNKVQEIQTKRKAIFN